MNDGPHDKELSALFSSDSGTLVDEAFVQRCMTSIGRAQRGSSGAESDHHLRSGRHSPSGIVVAGRTRS
jgi:aconitase B